MLSDKSKCCDSSAASASFCWPFRFSIFRLVIESRFEFEQLLGVVGTYVIMRTPETYMAMIISAIHRIVDFQNAILALHL
jgi:hypothetical protein